MAGIAKLELVMDWHGTQCRACINPAISMSSVKVDHYSAQRRKYIIMIVTAALVTMSKPKLRKRKPNM